MQYGLGWHLMVMADRIDLYQELPRLAMPYLEELMRRTRETTHLMALDGDEVCYLAKVESPETIRMASRVGARMPAVSTAGGKALLAGLGFEGQGNGTETLGKRFRVPGQPFLPTDQSGLPTLEILQIAGGSRHG